MNGINLLPWREEKKRLQHKKLAVVNGVLLIGVLGLILGQYWYFLNEKNVQGARNAVIAEGIRKHDEKILDLENEDTSYLALHDWLVEIDRHWHQRRQVVTVLGELMERLPEHVIYDRIHRTRASLILTGRSSSDAGVSQTIRLLSESPLFSSISIEMIETESKQQQQFTNFVFNLLEVK